MTQRPVLHRDKDSENDIDKFYNQQTSADSVANKHQPQPKLQYNARNPLSPRHAVPDLRASPAPIYDSTERMIPSQRTGPSIVTLSSSPARRAAPTRSMNGASPQPVAPTRVEMARNARSPSLVAATHYSPQRTDPRIDNLSGYTRNIYNDNRNVTSTSRVRQVQGQVPSSDRQHDNQYHQPEMTHNGIHAGGIRAEYQNIPPGSKVVCTAYGTFIVPDTSHMTRTELSRERESYTTKFRQLNSDWQHTGIEFRLPSKDEDVGNIAVRYKEAEKFLLTKTGTDFWFIALCAGWSLIEYGCKRMGINADGYVVSQIKMYKMYQSQLTKMGETSGFGQDWPPWVQVLVTAAANALLLIILGLIAPGARDYSTQIMGSISGMITGANTEVEMSAEGTPKPSGGGLAETISNAVGNFSGGENMSLSGVFDLIKSFTGMGSKKKKLTLEEKAAKRIARRAGPDIDIDDI
jgi:hypothetical protein